MKEYIGEIIVAIPATIAAGAAWRATLRNEARIRTANGDTMGAVVDKTYQKLETVEVRLNDHISDSWAHRS